MTLPTTTKKRDSGRKVGIFANHQCFACRKFLKRDRSVNYVQFFFCYSICKMPICRESKVNRKTGRAMTYLEEHAHSDESHLCCNDFIYCWHFPKEK